MDHLLPRGWGASMTCSPSAHEPIRPVVRGIAPPRGGSALGAQQPLLLALPLAVLLGVALVVLLLALGEADGHLDAGLRVVEVERHQRTTALLHLADELAQLLRVQQQLARARGIRMHMRG